jgi:hypothetical protein
MNPTLRLPPAPHRHRAVVHVREEKLEAIHEISHRRVRLLHEFVALPVQTCQQLPSRRKRKQLTVSL